MGRLLLLLLLVFFGLLLWRKLVSGGAPKVSSETKEHLTESVVPCTLCGLHVPLSEAVVDGDQHFCCPEHRRQARGE